MSVNLLNIAKDYLTPGVMRQVGSMIGESESGVQSAIGGALPSLLGGLVKNASTESGANELFNMLGDHKGGMLGDLMGYFTGGNQESMLSTGGNIVKYMLGGSSGNSVIDTLSRISGMGRGSSSSLLSLLAPIVMGIIGKTKNDMNLDSGGVASLLMDQQKYIKEAAPSGIADMLGIGSLTSGLGAVGAGTAKVASNVKNTGERVVSGAGDAGRKVVGGTADAGRKVVGGAADTAKSGGSLLKKLLPLLLLLGIGLLAFPFIRGCGEQTVDVAKKTTSTVVEGTKNATNKAVDVTKNAANKAADVTKDAAGKAVDAAKSVGAAAMGLAKGTMEYDFAEFLSGGAKDLNKTFILNKVEFDTGKATLRASSNAQLDNVVKIMKNYPNLHIQLRGHTDNTGDAGKNKTLSANRSKAAKDYLVSKGINAKRLSNVGLGSTQPVADNKTAPGRQKNRRTDIKITKR